MGNSCNSTIFQMISPMLSHFSNKKFVVLRLAQSRLLQMHATCVSKTLPLQCSACSSVVHICSERRPLVYSPCAAMSDHVQTVDSTCQTLLALCFLSCHAIFNNFRLSPLSTMSTLSTLTTLSKLSGSTCALIPFLPRHVS